VPVGGAVELGLGPADLFAVLRDPVAILHPSE
jgi:hypothetical protein